MPRILRKAKNPTASTAVVDMTEEPCAHCKRQRPMRDLVRLNGRYRCSERWDCKKPD